MRSENIKKIDYLRLSIGMMLAAFGACFLGLFIYIVTWKLPTYPQETFPGYSHAISVPFSGWRDERLNIRANERLLDFAFRATVDIHKATYNCGVEQGASWVSQILARFDALSFREYGVLSPKHLKCGFCHQRAYILDRALRRAGVDSELRGLEGHVVTMFRIDDTTYIADPDYGVGPFAIDPLSEGQMSVVADQHYIALWDKLRVMDPDHYKIHYDNVDAAYKKISNDGPYMTATFLDDLSDQQEKFLNFAEKAKYLIVIIGLVLTYFGARILVVSLKRA